MVPCTCCWQAAGNRQCSRRLDESAPSIERTRNIKDIAVISTNTAIDGMWMFDPSWQVYVRSCSDQPEFRIDFANDVQAMCSQFSHFSFISDNPASNSNRHPTLLMLRIHLLLIDDAMSKTQFILQSRAWHCVAVVGRSVPNVLIASKHQRFMLCKVSELY